MTSPPSPRNRRGRRMVVITIAVAVLAAGLGWWMWPRVDQRFVGTWRYTDEDFSRYWRFHGDGTGEDWSQDAGEPPGEPIEWNWYFDGEAIVTRNRRYDWTDRIPLRVVRTLGQAIDLDIFVNGLAFRPIEAIEPSQMRAGMDYADQMDTLHRVRN
jgi:hypothetical protein